MKMSLKELEELLKEDRTNEYEAMIEFGNKPLANTGPEEDEPSAEEVAEYLKSLENN